MSSAMVKNNMNYLAILIAAVAAWIFGGLYYTALHSVWVGALDKPPATGALPHVISFIAELVMAWVLAGMVGRLGANQVTPRNAVIYAVSGWLGFIMGVIVSANAYTGRSPVLTMIDGGHWLGVVLILGFVIGWMGVRNSRS